MTNPEPGIVFIYVTHPSAAQAAALARNLVDEQLAACVNILPGMHAIYRWHGNIEESDETVLIIKAPATSFHKIATAVKARHPYETPCIVALPITEGSPDYLAWLESADVHAGNTPGGLNARPTP